MGNISNHRPKLMNNARSLYVEQISRIKIEKSETSLKREDILRTKRIGEEVERSERNPINRTH